MREPVTAVDLDRYERRARRRMWLRRIAVGVVATLALLAIDSRLSNDRTFNPPPAPRAPGAAP